MLKWVRSLTGLASMAALLLVSPACRRDAGWECVLADDADADFAPQLGCESDFQALASAPLDASIPGARSVKTVVDRVDEGRLYFQNSERYPIHWEFASAHLSGDGLPIVPGLSGFNTTEYFSPDRRFILGAVTWYEEPQVWAWELSPYDTANVDLITQAFRTVRDNAWFGEDLVFHPTSDAIETRAVDLPDDIPVMTTDELFDGITFQPLNLGTSMGLLAYHTADDVEDGNVWFREIVVLDAVPNDIAVVMGIITDDFQTPLSHINVLSQNRGTPNMARIGAWDAADLRALEGKWVELTVEPNGYAVREVTQAEADAWWDANQPEPLDVTPMDPSVTGLWDEGDILDSELSLAEGLTAALPVFGGKASHFAGMAAVEEVPHPTAFAVPVHYYDAHMRNNGLYEVARAMMDDPEFQSDTVVRSQKLAELRQAIEEAPVDPDFIDLVERKIRQGVRDGLYPSTRFRFRSSTNAEDTSGFNGAGLYTSKTGDPQDPGRPVDEAIREVWASLWSSRAFEERAYYGIDHLNIGMALLCHRGFPDEKANGVAITGNIYDLSGLEPAFYINVQHGEESVVFPEPGVTTDQIIYYFDRPNQPAVYIQHSNLIPSGQTVLTSEQLHALGGALKAIHQQFLPVYGRSGGFYAMDTEFKFDIHPESGELELFVKQARPYPGWSRGTE